MDDSKRAEPFLQRADELMTHEPVVSYYCRLHAISLLGKGRTAHTLSAEGTSRLVAELTKAEEQKAKLDLTCAQETVEAFALSVFEAADSKDKAGLTDEASKRQFYVAGQFLDACAAFYDGQLPPDLAEKSRYAKFRAMQIHDCLKRGVSPVPEVLPGDAADT
eukprot:CAMPEP_0176293432 /NCGR_PEP_ID=MMETSP0121_2-20121125/56607_1 /TAXON_ID=160619 /ORGANISM="Kryptoperidinium foliaceum, Strain CCMP 1326" /LENGTH=162 /DNA_ID=CAMNT_0017634397 /DNA_START=18 /DNA_END=502 /DNA_ORIENTATION=-